jgi:hypothetical protein
MKEVLGDFLSKCESILLIFCVKFLEYVYIHVQYTRYVLEEWPTLPFFDSVLPLYCLILLYSMTGFLWTHFYPSHFPLSLSVTNVSIFVFRGRGSPVWIWLILLQLIGYQHATHCIRISAAFLGATEEFNCISMGNRRYMLHSSCKRAYGLGSQCRPN